MKARSEDIFSSDLRFIAFASSCLVGLGLIFLLLGLSCKISTWAYCDLTLVSLFGGMPQISKDFSMLNLPLAMLMIGVSLRLYTGFGWGLCIFIIGVLALFFGAVSVVMYQNLQFHLKLELGLSGNLYSPYWEALISNFVLALLCSAGCAFLALPSVRRLYWTRSNASSSNA